MSNFNKKGFTLVELLAVIAILAILMLLITPNILNLFTEGKASAFKTQVQRIYKAAEQEYITASMSPSGQPGPYCYNGADEGKDGNHKLSISENKSLHYYVAFNARGEITTLKVTDGTYFYDSTATGFTLGLDSMDGKIAKNKPVLSCIDATLTAEEAE